MKCPECEKEGKVSKVYPRGGITTDLACSPFYDDEGVYHYHDCNVVRWSYSCSNGHRWTHNQKNKCQSCDWTIGGDDEA